MKLYMDHQFSKRCDTLIFDIDCELFYLTSINEYKVVANSITILIRKRIKNL